MTKVAKKFARVFLKLGFLSVVYFMITIYWVTDNALGTSG